MNPESTLRWARHLAICLILLVGPGLFLAPPTLWRLDRRLWLVLAGGALAYLLAVITTPARRDAAAGAALLRFGAFSSIWILGVAVWEAGLLGSTLPGYSRPAMLTSVAVGAAGLLLDARAGSGTWPAFIAVAVAGFACLAGQAAFHKNWLPRPRGPEQKIAVLNTAVYQLRLTSYLNSIPGRRADDSLSRWGGGIAHWGQDYLLATGEGGLYVFNEDRAQRALRIRPLPYQAPMNYADFQRGAAEVFRDAPGTVIETNRFRLAGVLVQDMGEQRRVLVTHHTWDAANHCYRMRLSALEGTPAQFEAASMPLHWRTVFETSPCLRLNASNPRISHFDGHETGGRLAAMPDGAILMSVGDTAYDGVTRPESVSQDPSSNWGKVLRIDLATGKAQVLSSGHRNPQGLFVNAGGIWESEHGPRGGDELNHIVSGRDYGWPTVTYGTTYAGLAWPRNPRPEHHEGFEPPVYAFVPSVGVSAITSGNPGRFPQWQDDLLLATLKAETLFRMRITGNRVDFAEPIPIGQRIRDLLPGSDGRLVLWTDSGAILFMEPSAADQGEAVAIQCRACHGLSKWDPPSSQGPNLGGILDRRIAADPHFTYSPALKNLGGTWSRKRLDEFLASPATVARGTTMNFPGIPDPQQRRLLIEYLGNPIPDD